MSKDAILKQIKDEDIEYVDIRFTDPRGKLQHVTVMADQVDEDFLEEGFMFDGSAIQGVEVIAERVDGQDQTATRSLSDGYFSFDVLSPGRWRLRIGGAALPDDWRNPPVDLGLEAGQQRFDVAVTAMPPES